MYIYADVYRERAVDRHTHIYIYTHIYLYIQTYVCYYLYKHTWKN